MHTRLHGQGATPVPLRWQKEIEQILITQEQLAKRVAEMTRQIERDYQNRELVVVSLLTGTVMFLADLIRHLMDQHGLTRADLIPLLGTPSRVSEVMHGKKGLSMAMVQRLRARFRVSADLLLPPPKESRTRRATKRAAA